MATNNKPVVFGYGEEDEVESPPILLIEEPDEDVVEPVEVQAPAGEALQVAEPPLVIDENAVAAEQVAPPVEQGLEIADPALQIPHIPEQGFGSSEILSGMIDPKTGQLGYGQGVEGLQIDPNAGQPQESESDSFFKKTLSDITSSSLWDDPGFWFDLSKGFAAGKGDFLADAGSALGFAGSNYAANQRSLDKEAADRALEQQELGIKQQKADSGTATAGAAVSQADTAAGRLANAKTEAEKKEAIRISNEEQEIGTIYREDGPEAAIKEARARNETGTHNYIPFVNALIASEGQAGQSTGQSIVQPAATPEAASSAPKLRGAPTPRQVKIPHVGRETATSKAMVASMKSTVDRVNRQRTDYDKKATKSDAVALESMEALNLLQSQLYRDGGGQRYTGTGGVLFNNFKNIVDVGRTIIGDKVQDMTKNDIISAITEKMTLRSRVAPDGTVYIGAQTSNFEIRLMKNTIPGLDKSMEANTTLITLLNRASRRSLSATKYGRQVNSSVGPDSYIEIAEIEAANLERKEEINKDLSSIREYLQAEDSNVKSWEDVAMKLARMETLPDSVIATLSKYDEDYLPVDGSAVPTDRMELVAKLMRGLDYVDSKDAIDAQNNFVHYQNGSWRNDRNTVETLTFDEDGGGQYVYNPYTDTNGGA
ncbi:MAG: hypothetical protein ACR2N8_03045 [Parvibaculales bacterium]